MEYFKNTSGFQQALADSRAQVLAGAVGKLTPEESDAYDATMATFATVVGLRSLTRASSAQFSIQRIESELPTIGINTLNSRTFYNKLSRFGEEIYNGARTIPRMVFDKPGEYEFYQSLPTRAKALKEGQPAGGRFPVVAPDKKTYYFDTQAEANTFKKVAGIR
jgi:hypothetical protein